ncbi:MAG TPA: pirin family protein [Candidatus Stackebrandtia excrementipullorum]|nr:pirin family protein [Candidatus Stackebrandtia excrementipullorum]
MSDLDIRPTVRECGGRADVTAQPVRELLTGRDMPLGESTVVRRLLPTLGRRMIGAWCFVDHYGPDDIVDKPGMQVPPHPHTGLQTVSWLRQGEILHNDSLGSSQVLTPGALGLMTAGRGISHSEQTPRSHAPLLHGAQLWVALPDEHRHVAPAWEYHQGTPVDHGSGVTSTVILGEFANVTSPGTTYSPLVGVALDVAGGTSTNLPLERDFEYAALAMHGRVDIDGVPVEPGSLLYLGSGRSRLPVEATHDGAVMLLGGEPFEEKLLMWWNFIGRTDDEVRRYRDQWQQRDPRFGEVDSYDGARLSAPPFPDLPLKPRGRTR